jgi:uncharacterized protein (DUF983 family)
MGREPPVKGPDRVLGQCEAGCMPALVTILIVVGIVLLLLGIFVEAVKFLLWLGLVLLVIGVIVWLLKFIKRKA